jgi:hypothetical protein
MDAGTAYLHQQNAPGWADQGEAVLPRFPRRKAVAVSDTHKAAARMQGRSMRSPIEVQGCGCCNLPGRDWLPAAFLTTLPAGKSGSIAVYDRKRFYVFWGWVNVVLSTTGSRALPASPRDFTLQWKFMRPIVEYMDYGSRTGQ